MIKEICKAALTGAVSALACHYTFKFIQKYEECKAEQK